MNKATNTSVQLNKSTRMGGGVFLWMKSSCVIVGWLGLAVSALWLIVASVCLYYASHKEKTWTPATATVEKIEAHEYTSRDRSATSEGESMRVFFGFEAANGSKYTVKSIFSVSPSRPLRYSLGDKVELIYPDAAPSEAIIKSFSRLYTLPIILYVAGVMFGAMGLALLYVGRRMEKSEGRSLQP